VSVPKAIFDLHRLEEDKRIDAIGNAAKAGNRVGVMLERKDKQKQTRYTEKITTRFPGVVLLGTTNGPTSLVVTLRFGLRPSPKETK
jgi:hypothetical protein